MKTHLLIIAAVVLLLVSSCNQVMLNEEPSVELSGKISDSRSLSSIWYLENHMSNSTNLDGLYDVYWCARDLASSPVGNHHFITLIYGSEDQAKRITAKYGIGYRMYKNQKGMNIPFTTIGASSSGGYLIEIINEGNDVQAVKEQINPDAYISWWKPDFDLEGHWVPYTATTQATSREHFISLCIEKALNFNFNLSRGIRIGYQLDDKNCATVVNTNFEYLGVSESDRVLLGEFSGVDWGEEDLFSRTFFEVDDFIPVMTANSSAGTYAYSSSNYSSSYEPWRAFDGNDQSGTWSRWISAIGQFPAWIRVQLSSAQTVTRYFILPELGDGTSNRAPKNWVLQGSADGSSWVTVDTRNNITLASNWVAAGLPFTVQNAGYYNNYRLWVTDVNGSVLTSIRQLKLNR